MSVGIVGSGPAAGAVEAALADVDAAVDAVERQALPEFDLAVVVGHAGDAVFEQVNEDALEVGLRWLAVELGGVGGYPVVDAAVAGFDPGGACYECLSGRVAANLDPQTEPAAAPPAHTARYAGAVAGRAAARHLAADHDPFGQVIEIPQARRTVLPLPDCACAGPQRRTLPHSHEARDLDEALGRAEQGLDGRVGIVAEVGEAESFPVPYYLAHACDTTGFSDVAAAQDAAGVAAGWDAAFMKALGEAMERYCAGVYRVDDLHSAPVAEVDDAVHPREFVTEGGAEPGDAAIPWVTGEHLASGETVSLPAEFVFYPPPAERFRSAITTGLGLGNSDVEAMLSGLYEVIERDAAMIAWYSTYEPLALDIEDEGFDRLAARARSEDLSVSPILLTQDVDVPVVAVAVHREDWPAFALGSAAHLDPHRAARSALTEAMQNWMELRGMGEDGADDAPGRIGTYAARPPEAEDLIDPPTSVPAESVGPDDVPTGQMALEDLQDRLEDADMTPYAVRTTTRDVEALGFEAVRALVPTAQPLFFEDAYFGGRAEAVPTELGFEPDLERAHHPFP